MLWMSERERFTDLETIAHEQRDESVEARIETRRERAVGVDGRSRQPECRAGISGLNLRPVDAEGRIERSQLAFHSEVEER